MRVIGITYLPAYSTKVFLDISIAIVPTNQPRFLLPGLDSEVGASYCITVHTWFTEILSIGVFRYCTEFTDVFVDVGQMEKVLFALPNGRLLTWPKGTVPTPYYLANHMFSTSEQRIQLV